MQTAENKAEGGTNVFHYEALLNATYTPIIRTKIAEDAKTIKFTKKLFDTNGKPFK